ncbi:MAG: hypothetical protein ABFD91_16060 [Anaerohalosphaeraceae bacterium]
MRQVGQEEGTPYIHDISIKNIESIDSEMAFAVAGRKNQRAGRFIFDNILIKAATAGTISNAEDWTFTNVRIETKDGTKWEWKNCKNLQGLE